MSLEVSVRRQLGSFRLDVQFEADKGLTALFGRSGSGKTSVVNIIAGLLQPDEGRVVIDGVTLIDTTQRVLIPMHRRRVGYVFQEGRLFPHLTVRQNLLYGRWFSEDSKHHGDFAHVIEMLGLEALLDRRPGKLSGGEKQRVAIGRALLASPRLLLMDEPLASLDEPRKQEILPYLERLRDESRIPIVYVSHSVAEVSRLATTIIVLSDGRVATAGPAADIMQRVDLFPMTGRAEAGAIIEAVVEGHDEATGLTMLRSRAGLWRLPRLTLDSGSRVRVRVRARDVMLSASPLQDVSALNIFPAVVAELGDPSAPIIDVRLDCAGDFLVARLTRHSVERLGLARGVRVHAVIKAVALDRRTPGARPRQPTSMPPKSEPASLTDAPAKGH